MKHRHRNESGRRRWPGTGRRLTVLTAAAACTAGSMAAAPVAQAASDSGSTAPAAAGPDNAHLNAVTADSATDAWAVGYYRNGNALDSLILHWDGTSWKRVAAPSPGPKGDQNITLTAVSADSPTDAWAVGQFYTGNGYRSLTLHWDGTKWTKIVSPDPGGLSAGGELRGVTAISPTDAWAMGSYRTLATPEKEVSLILRWNGTKWTRAGSPSPGGLNGTYLEGGAVTAGSTTGAWAVGYYYTSSTGVPMSTLTEQWNGTKWVQVASPTPNPANDDYLYGVSSDSATDAWAVGYYDNGGLQDTLALHWDGTSWTQATTPNPGTSGSFLSGVSADSATDAWAVGYDVAYDVGGVQGYVPYSLILHWDGTSWTQATSPSPGGAGGTYLNGVAATSTGNAWAVGYYVNSSGVQQTLILRWNGTKWTKVKSPSP